MATSFTTNPPQCGEQNLETAPARGSNLMVMHARQANAIHLLVIDPDHQELESIGYLMWAQGYKVSLSSELLDPESLGYIAPDLLIVRPPFGHTQSWGEVVGTTRHESHLLDVPVVWLADPNQQLPHVPDAKCLVLRYPCRPLDFLTLVDTLVLTSGKPEFTQTNVAMPPTSDAGFQAITMSGMD